MLKLLFIVSLLFVMPTCFSADSCMDCTDGTICCSQTCVASCISGSSIEQRQRVGGRRRQVIRYPSMCVFNSAEEINQHNVKSFVVSVDDTQLMLISPEGDDRALLKLRDEYSSNITYEVTDFSGTRGKIILDRPFPHFQGFFNQGFLMLNGKNLKFMCESQR